MNKNNTKYPLPVGKRFKYRNQEYVVAKPAGVHCCSLCKEINKQYIKNNPYECVALTKNRTNKFCCGLICGCSNYPLRIK